MKLAAAPAPSRLKRRLLFLAFIAATVGLLYLLWPGDNAAGSGEMRPGSAQSKIEHRKSKIPLDVHDVARELNSPAHDIRADLQIVSTVLETYRSNFLREGNPAGNNREITATLAGDNRLRLALLAPTHPAINAAGELCDRWGTPFFFHAESGTQMEIRSAGPDRKLFTTDDAVLAP